MDKKKVKELIENAIYQLDPFSMDNSNYADLCKNATKILEDALKELSKSDWASVEDRLPPKNVVVQVCNKQEPDDLILAYRTNQETMKIVYPSNIVMYSFTHWKPIEKLEE